MVRRTRTGGLAGRSLDISIACAVSITRTQHLGLLIILTALACYVLVRLW
jgi:hypothetical protein